MATSCNHKSTVWALLKRIRTKKTIGVLVLDTPEEIKGIVAGL